jgi:hypothetical protein
MFSHWVANSYWNESRVKILLRSLKAITGASPTIKALENHRLGSRELIKELLIKAGLDRS